MAQALISSSIRQGAQMRKKNTPATTTKKWRIHLGYYQVLPCLAHFSQPLHRWRMLMMAASFDNKTHTHTNKFLRDFFFQENFFFWLPSFLFDFFYTSAPSTPVWDDVFSWFTLFSVIFLCIFFYLRKIGKSKSKGAPQEKWQSQRIKKKKKRENKGTACAGLGASLRWLSAGALCWRQAGVTDL